MATGKIVRLPNPYGWPADGREGSLESLMRILVVDDDADTCALIADILEDEGYRVHPCLSGERALEILKHEPFDLILSDIRMPRVTGIDLLLQVRRMKLPTEVILITAYASLETAVQALRGEAFDYLVKPFSLTDLRESVRRALTEGRDRSRSQALVQYRQLAVDVKGRRVWLRDNPVELTRLEFNLLAYLIQRLGCTVPAQELLERVWDEDERSVETLRSCVRRLRNRLSDDGQDPEYIKNVWGVGYQLGE
jgi:two-component system, OmpR family, response regulator VanR